MIEIYLILLALRDNSNIVKENLEGNCFMCAIDKQKVILTPIPKLTFLV